MFQINKKNMIASIYPENLTSPGSTATETGREKLFWTKVSAARHSLDYDLVCLPLLLKTA